NRSVALYVEEVFSRWNSHLSGAAAVYRVLDGRKARDLSLDLEVARRKVFLHGKRGGQRHRAAAVRKFEVRLQYHFLLRACQRVRLAADELLKLVQMENALLLRGRSRLRPAAHSQQHHNNTNTLDCFHKLCSLKSVIQLSSA